jgi:small subunit ribosomal protein S9
MSERRRIVLTTGKRKTAIARAVARPGRGIVTVNDYPLENFSPELARLKIYEPVMLAGDRRKNIDVRVRVSGGGMMSQAEAARVALARALVEWTRSAELRKIFLAYDRSLLAGDPRRKEMKKFGGPGARRRKQKSYR